ncbi:potassium channel protein [Paenibacillus silviterrae]|uniref:potassium channel protein n=1 Tax=Paenibacillus silviterrae TaxID=3242194 RepID=UPI002542E0C7|nr:potassium channel family protein [Paenibacillus chinjuensis]
MLFFIKFFLQIVRMNNRFIFTLAAVFIACSSLAAYLLEPDNFGSWFNGLWWVMTTVTTVGYGDFAPKTVLGKVLGMLIYIFGIGLISVTISKFIDALFLYQRKKEEGKLRYTGENHFVMIDWSKHAEHAIKEILRTDPAAEIVLIDTLEKSPIEHEKVHYIQGNPVKEETLQMANLGKARAVFIFSMNITVNQHVLQDTSFIDGKALLIATTIERCFKHVYTVVEIQNKDHLPNFEHIQIDDFIFAGETISQLAVRSAFSPGTSRLFSQLLTRNDGDDLYEIPYDKRWITFRDAFEDLLSQGATLVSDGSDLNINRRLQERMPPDARLFVICDKETYLRLTGK